MDVLKLFKKINTFVFDVDGVLTDGSLLVLPGGVMARRMNIKDGYALQLAIKKGYHVCIISGGKSEEVLDRLTKLGVADVMMQVTNKEEALKAYLGKNNCNTESVLFMGDDIPDIAVMKLAGLACCPADAASDIRSFAHYISPFKGGEGCARDVIEKVMKLQGNWNEDTSVRAQ